MAVIRITTGPKPSKGAVMCASKPGREPHWAEIIGTGDIMVSCELEAELASLPFKLRKVGDADGGIALYERA